MPHYNMTRRADRAQCRADQEAEIAAIDAGAWPRDINDSMRTSTRGCSEFDGYRANHVTMMRNARERCEREIAYIEGIPERIRSGELPGWEI